LTIDLDISMDLHTLVLDGSFSVTRNNCLNISSLNYTTSEVHSNAVPIYTHALIISVIWDSNL